MKIANNRCRWLWIHAHCRSSAEYQCPFTCIILFCNLYIQYFAIYNTLTHGYHIQLYLVVCLFVWCLAHPCLPPLVQSRLNSFVCLLVRPVGSGSSRRACSEWKVNNDLMSNRMLFTGACFVKGMRVYTCIHECASVWCVCACETADPWLTGGSGMAHPFLYVFVL